MKNSYANSMCSLKSANYNDNYLSRSNRSMVPILTSDFESRLMLNSKLPQKKSLSEEIRKNDFTVDFHKNTSYTIRAQSKSTSILKTCLDNSESEIDEKYLTKNLKKSKSKDEGTNDSIKSLISESFKTFNLIDIDKKLGSASITKTTSQMHSINKENINYIKPWVESCKYYSSNSLAYNKNTSLAKSTLTVNNTVDHNDFDIHINKNNNKLIKNNQTNVIIKNIEYKVQTPDEDKENYNTLKPNYDGSDLHERKGSLLMLPRNHSISKPKRAATMVDLDVQNMISKPPVYESANANKKKNISKKLWQCKIYNFLERPRGWKAIVYHAFVFLTVLVCLILSVLVTIPSYEAIASYILMYTEGVIVVWLSAELCLRVWSAGCRSRYQTWKGRLKFMKNVFCILDLIVITATIVLIIMASVLNKHTNFAAAAFRGLRFFQILRMLRVDRRAGTWRLLATVIWAHRQELITTFYIGFLSLITSSFIMYLIEKDEKDTKIRNFADSLWWGVITLCTIGYGDVYPKSAAGKLLASCCALIGISFFALPAGILGSGFALKVQAMQRQKHLNRRRTPAAQLIQCVWRCYAADPDSVSSATWKPHVKALAAASFPTKQNTLAPSSINPMSKHGSTYSIFNRFASIKKPSPPEHLDAPNKSYIKTNSFIQPHIPLSTNQETQTKKTDSNLILNLFNANTSVYANSEHQVVYTKETNEKGSVSNILLKNPLKMKSSEHHHQQSLKIAPIKSSLAHRTLNFLSESIHSSSVIRTSDSDEKIQNEDEDKEKKLVLTTQHKHAIRALRKIRYFVARRKFKEALRPYDVTDVIEQYSAGNLDMLARIKILQFRLDKILGSSKSKDCYDSNNKPLAYRIIKCEKQMSAIDIKLDKFISSYSNDMKLILEKLTTLNAKANEVTLDATNNNNDSNNNYNTNEPDNNFRKRMSSLLIKSNSNPMDSTYHLRNFNSNSINEIKDLMTDKVHSLNGNDKMHSLQDSELFRINFIDKLKAKRLKQLGVRALSFSFEKEKKLSILASDASKDDVAYIDSDLDMNDDDMYFYAYADAAPYAEEERTRVRDIPGDINYGEKSIWNKSIPKRILNKTDSEQTSTPSPKRSRKFKRPNKLAMKLYFMNAIKQNKPSLNTPDRSSRRCKSDSELSLYSGGSGLQNFISIKRKISFYRSPDDVHGQHKTNLSNFAAKSDINIKTDDTNVKMNNNFKELLKRKNSENLKSNTPRIFISKPDEMNDDNPNNF